MKSHEDATRNEQKGDSGQKRRPQRGWAEWKAFRPELRRRRLAKQGYQQPRRHTVLPSTSNTSSARAASCVHRAQRPVSAATSAAAR